MPYNHTNESAPPSRQFHPQSRSQPPPSAAHHNKSMRAEGQTGDQTGGNLPFMRYSPTKLGLIVRVRLDAQRGREHELADGGGEAGEEGVEGLLLMFSTSVSFWSIIFQYNPSFSFKFLLLLSLCMSFFFVFSLKPLFDDSLAWVFSLSCLISRPTLFQKHPPPPPKRPPKPPSHGA